MAVTNRSERLAGVAAFAVAFVVGLLLIGEGDMLGAQLPGSWSFFGLSTLQLVAVGGTLLITAYVLSSSESDISVPFVFTGVALLFGAWALLPAEWQAMLPLDGLAPSGLDAATFALLIGAAVVVYYVVAERSGSGAKTASTTAKKVSNDLENLAGEWAEALRWAVVGFIGTVVVVLAQGGPILGTVTDFLAEAPVVVAAVATAALGYLGLSGLLDVSPRIYILAGAAILALGVGVKYGD